MADPSTPNHSNSDPDEKPKSETGAVPPIGADSASDGAPSPEGIEQAPHKLKLRKLLTPLSPHLSARRPEQGERVERERRPFEIPHAVPIDPEPDVRPEEIEKPPLETPVHIPTGPNPFAPKETQEQKAGPPNEEPLEEETQEEEEEATAEKKVPPSAKKSMGKRLVVLLVPVVLVIAVLFILNYLLDPFGSKVEPITPLAQPAITRQKEVSSTKLSESVVSTSNLADQLESQSVENYLETLKEQKLIISKNPKGLFINSVFFPEGSEVNPYLGLQFEGIDEAGSEPLIILMDSRMRVHMIPVR